MERLNNLHMVRELLRAGLKLRSSGSRTYVLVTSLARPPFVRTGIWRKAQPYLELKHIHTIRTVWWYVFSIRFAKRKNNYPYPIYWEKRNQI